MGHFLKTLSVMQAPNGRGIYDELTAIGCDVTLVRRSTRNYAMVISFPSGEEHVMEFTTAGGDIMLTSVPINPGPIAA